MNKLSFAIAALLLIASCNSSNNTAGLQAAVAAKAESTVKGTLSVFQRSIDNKFNQYEVISLKADPVRSRPVWDRAVKVKDFYKRLEAYLDGLRTSMPGQAGADFDKSKDELAHRISEADKTVSDLLDASEKSSTRNYLLVKDTAGLTQANAATIVGLMLIDMKATEYSCVSAILSIP